MLKGREICWRRVPIDSRQMKEIWWTKGKFSCNELSRRAPLKNIADLNFLGNSTWRARSSIYSPCAIEPGDCLKKNPRVRIHVREKMEPVEENRQFLMIIKCILLLYQVFLVLGAPSRRRTTNTCTNSTITEKLGIKNQFVPMTNYSSHNFH